MPSTGALLLMSIVLFFMAGWGSLSFCYPQLAFRFENIFELRSVELSGFGIFVQKAGGVLLMGVAIVLPVALQSFVLLLPTLLGLVLPPIHFRRTRGVIIVQSLFDPAIEQQVEERQQRNRPP